MVCFSEDDSNLAQDGRHIGPDSGLCSSNASVDMVDQEIEEFEVVSAAHVPQMLSHITSPLLSAPVVLIRQGSPEELHAVHSLASHLVSVAGEDVDQGRNP